MKDRLNKTENILYVSEHKTLIPDKHKAKAMPGENGASLMEHISNQRMRHPTLKIGGPCSP